MCVCARTHACSAGRESVDEAEVEEPAPKPRVQRRHPTRCAHALQRRPLRHASCTAHSVRSRGTLSTHTAHTATHRVPCTHHVLLAPHQAHTTTHARHTTFALHRAHTALHHASHCALPSLTPIHHTASAHGQHSAQHTAHSMRSAQCTARSTHSAPHSAQLSTPHGASCSALHSAAHSACAHTRLHACAHAEEEREVGKGRAGGCRVSW